MAALVGIDAEILFVSSATLAALPGAVTSVSVGAQGSGYSVSDTLTLTGGGADATVDVATIGGGGEVLTVTISAGGTGYAVATGVATTGGGGSGCTIDIDAIDSSIVLPTWDASTETWTLSVNGASYSWVQMTERNEVSININVDVAEHKVFVTSLSEAWVEKARLYMDWSGSLSGYYDDASDVIFETMRAGQNLWMLIFDSKRATSKYWLGQCLLTSVDHSTPNEDFSTLEADFEGNGKLYRSALPS